MVAGFRQFIENLSSENSMRPIRCSMRGRRLTLKPYLTSEQLEARFRLATTCSEARHWLALWFISQGQSVSDTAIATDLPKPHVQQLIYRFNNFGEEGVFKQRTPASPGRPRRLTASQTHKISQALAQSPPDGATWTGRKVADWVWQELDLKISQTFANQLLRARVVHPALSSDSRKE